MSTTADLSADQILPRVTALAPLLQRNAQAAETARRVPAENYDALAEAGVFRMTAPRRFGGAEADFKTQYAVLAEIARCCPSTAWVATIYSAMSWVAGVFPDEAQQEILSSRDPRISGVLSPTVKAKRRDGGFAVTGRWPFNTGCHGSNWTLLSAVLEEGPGVPLCFLVPSRELRILDDWNTTGMAGTGSNTVVAEELFVPQHRVLLLPDMMEGRYPARHNAANPYFHYPLASVLVVNAVGVPVGIARGAYAAFFERVHGRPITHTFYMNKAEAPVTHLQVAEAAMKIESAEAHSLRACALLDEHDPKSGPISKMARVKARAYLSYSTGQAREAVDGLFYASGASASQTQVQIQRFQRDIQTLANHAILHTQTAMELYGRVLCGLEPNTLLY